MTLLRPDHLGKEGVFDAALGCLIGSFESFFFLVEKAGEFSRFYTQNIAQVGCGLGCVFFGHGPY